MPKYFLTDNPMMGREWDALDYAGGVIGAKHEGDDVDYMRKYHAGDAEYFRIGEVVVGEVVIRIGEILAAAEGRTKRNGASP